MDPKEDWEKCLTWLVEVSPVSARSARQVMSERDLFNYLKDGAELCRMIGVLTRGKVPPGIVYRTQNIRQSHQTS